MCLLRCVPTLCRFQKILSLCQVALGDLAARRVVRELIRFGVILQSMLVVQGTGGGQHGGFDSIVVCKDFIITALPVVHLVEQGSIHSKTSIVVFKSVVLGPFRSASLQKAKRFMYEPYQLSFQVSGGDILLICFLCSFNHFQSLGELIASV